MTTDTHQFDLHRSLPVPPERLWQLLTDAKLREQWGAPSEGTVLTVITSDLRVGAEERHRCGPADAPEFEVTTRWYRLDAPHDAVFTETVHVAGETIATSLVTYRVSPEAGGARLSVTVAVSSFVGPEAGAEFHSGWEAGLNNLAALAARAPA
ncbi:hypothetical protein E4Z66_13540 [Aliishimia ponticola]|uniref:Activator of Hsp90 ATPase homologue 1/2-like C-terminal domain-containing protein n=1 Tax=Aliishimia ponticola TaxID=2499833 RepID=A0A4S4NC82_9RHOB|nr:SRPBCC domain-containing protein [Aliishimia ponticola]THH36077.1 hypothetical protein E4Z66_13540 [Aliishimia ponticola]